MNEIKFRAWADGEMHYDDFSIEFNGGEMDDMIAYTRKDGHVIVCSKFELMQYTGLKDKNGKEIYKGDELKGVNTYVMEVVWGKYGWSTKFIDNGNVCIEPMSDDLFYAYEPEVIGTVHDNPELIKEADK